MACLMVCVATIAWSDLRFTSEPDTTATVNRRYRYDLDGVPSVTSDGGTFFFQLVTAPEGMVVDNLSGELFWFPTAAGTWRVGLEARNEAGEVADGGFDVTVSSGIAPRFVPPTGVLVSLGVPVSLQLRAEAGDAPLTWQLRDGPMGALLQPETGAVSWVPTAAGTGRFNVSLTNAFGSVSGAFDVEVSNAPQPRPTAMLRVTPEEALPGTLVQLSASGSTAGTPDGSLSFLFDFGDGSPTRYGFEDSTQQGYVVPGVYTARVRVQNVHLNEDESTARVVVRTDAGLTPPAARILADRQGGEAAPVEARFECECRPGEAAIVTWEWEFGDGDTSDRPDPVHVFARPGGYNVKLRVVDAVGLEARDSFYLPVWSTDGGQRPPYSRARVRPTPVGEAPFEPELVAEFGDSDGIVVSRTWTLPDGRTITDEDPKLSLQALGTSRVELSVRDNDGLVSTDIIELRATRNGAVPPVIRSKPELEARVGAPYRYDEDSRASAINGPSRWAVGLVVDGQRVGAPDGLSVDEATGAVTWTPVAAQVGRQEVALTVTNAAGTAVQRFTVAVAETPPACGCSSGLSGCVLAALVLLARRRRSAVSVEAGPSGC